MVRPHVVGVGQAEVVVEAVPRRQELRVMAEVPLAEDGGGVAARLEHLGDASSRSALMPCLRRGSERAEDADAVRSSSRSAARRATPSRPPGRRRSR